MKEEQGLSGAFEAIVDLAFRSIQESSFHCLSSLVAFPHPQPPLPRGEGWPHAGVRVSPDGTPGLCSPAVLAFSSSVQPTRISLMISRLLGNVLPRGTPFSGAITKGLVAEPCSRFACCISGHDSAGCLSPEGGCSLRRTPPRWVGRRSTRARCCGPRDGV